MSPQDDSDTIMATLNSDDAILEEMIEFDCEISCLIARDRDGKHHHFPVSQNRHEAGILARVLPLLRFFRFLLTLPPRRRRLLLIRWIFLGFLRLNSSTSRDGRLLFNEIAPRPHNSFHWTIEGCATASSHSWQEPLPDSLLARHIPMADGRWTIFMANTWRRFQICWPPWGPSSSLWQTASSGRPQDGSCNTARWRLNSSEKSQVLS